MTNTQIKNTEEIANEVTKKNEVVYAKESPLAKAKVIQGIRAIFDEVLRFIYTRDIIYNGFHCHDVTTTLIVSYQVTMAKYLACHQEI